MLRRKLGDRRVRLLDDLVDGVDVGPVVDPPAGEGPVLVDQVLAGRLDGRRGAPLARRQVDQLAGASAVLLRDVEVIAQEEQEGLASPTNSRARPDRVAIAQRLLLDGEPEPIGQFSHPPGLLLGPGHALVGRPEVGGEGPELACDRRPRPPGRATTQTSSIPLSIASSAMIWRTGLVRPSRSTSGSIAFWTVSKAGYCRGPRPAAVMTALVIRNARPSSDPRAGIALPAPPIAPGDPGPVGVYPNRRRAPRRASANPAP